MIQPLFKLTGNNEEMIDFMRSFLTDSEIGTQGVNELVEVFEKTALLGLSNAKLEFDVTLARGLNYYTGAIFEVKANGVKMGSICGGGRYDNLTGLFGMQGLSGVGISFGADRIYDVLTELELFPADITQNLDIFFVNFGERESVFCLPVVKKLRDNGLNAELYPSDAKLKKQFKYADDRDVKYTAIVGESEVDKSVINLKEMVSGEQVELSIDDFYKKFNIS
jgi:histidyl-tRNA synthetase